MLYEVTVLPIRDRNKTIPIGSIIDVDPAVAAKKPYLVPVLGPAGEVKEEFSDEELEKILDFVEEEPPSLGDGFVAYDPIDPLTEAMGPVGLSPEGAEGPPVLEEEAGPITLPPSPEKPATVQPGPHTPKKNKSPKHRGKKR